MILFLYGPDTYRSQQKLQEVIARYKKVHASGLNLQYVNLAGREFEDFRDKLRSSPMFKEKKLFILSQAFSNKEFAEKFLANKEMFLKCQDIIVFYEKGMPDKRGRLFKFLTTKAKYQEFDLLKPFRLRNWTEREISRLGAKISPPALNKLIDFVGSDLWRMQNEIKKIIAYKSGESTGEVRPRQYWRGQTSPLTSLDVELLVRPRIETDIFKTIDALVAKNKKSALCLLQEHLQKGDSPLYLLAMITYQFRNLLIIKELGEKQIPYPALAKKSKLHPFVVKKTYYQARQFTLQELKKIYQKLLAADWQIKTGKIEPELALDLLVAEI